MGTLYRPHRALPVGVGALIVLGSAALGALGWLLGQWELYLLAASGAALGGTMMVVPLVRHVVS